MIILSHRGLWEKTEERNTLRSFEKAFSLGLGVETDVRDMGGHLVISHDPPSDLGLPRLEELLNLYKAYGCPGALALNIKADGLQAHLANALLSSEVTKVFVFDMSVPDALGYTSKKIPTYTRQSEFELHPAFYGLAVGVWMDCFESDWFDELNVRNHLLAGKTVALVSPELHGRCHLEVWKRWSCLRAEKEVMICTDFPIEAMRFFNGV